MCILCVCICMYSVCVKECRLFFVAIPEKARDNNDPHTVLWEIICYFFAHNLYEAI